MRQNVALCGNGLNSNRYENTVACKVIVSALRPLPDDKILAQSQMKAFADDILNLTNLINFVFYRVENTGVGELGELDQI